MKYLATTLMAAAVLFGACLSPLQAAEPKPIAALAVASYNDLVSDVNFVGGLADQPNLGAAADGFIALATQFKGLAGIDKTRPIGAIIQAAGEGESAGDDIAGYVCVPITNFKQALGLLKLFNDVESEDGVYKLTPKDSGKTTYVKDLGTWAYISDKAESLAHVVADPLKALGGMEKNYIVSGRVFLGNVPDALREKFLAGLKEGIEKEAHNKKDDESDEQFAQRKKFLEKVEAYVTRVAGDLDQIHFGWGLDRAAEKTYLDLSVTAKPDTKTAEEMATASQAETNFANFRMADAATVWAIASPIPEAKQEIATSLLEVIRGQALGHIGKDAPESERDAHKEIVGEGFELLTKIIKSGRIDAVVTGLLSHDSATGLGAFYVADGDLFDKFVHSIVKGIKSEHPKVDQFVKLDAETVEGHKVHIITIPIPEDFDGRENLVKLIGEKLIVVIAVGKDNVYVGAGRDVGDKLKKAAVASGQTGPKSVPPVSISYAIQPIAGAVAELGKPGERPVAQMAVAELKKTPGEDHVSLTARSITNGTQVRLEVEKGVLRLAGHAAVMATGGKAAPAEKGDEK
jgi:hypothetical protein